MSRNFTQFQDVVIFWSSVDIVYRSRKGLYGMVEIYGLQIELGIGKWIAEAEEVQLTEF